MDTDTARRAAAFLAQAEIGDDAGETLDEMVLDMAHHAAADTANSMDDDSRDDELHDDADALGARINNEGREAQVAFLLENGCTEQTIRDTILDEDAAPAGP